MHLIGLDTLAQGGIDQTLTRQQALAFELWRDNRGKPMAAIPFCMRLRRL